MTFAKALNKMYVHGACIRLPDWGECIWYADHTTGRIMSLYINHKREMEEEEVIPSRVQMYVNREDWETPDRKLTCYMQNKKWTMLV